MKGRHHERWSDNQVLTVLRAKFADFPAVAETMGMPVTTAACYRGSSSVRGMRLRQRFGIVRPRFFPSGETEPSHQPHNDLIRAAIRGEHVE